MHCQLILAIAILASLWGFGAAQCCVDVCGSADEIVSSICTSTYQSCTCTSGTSGTTITTSAPSTHSSTYSAPECYVLTRESTTCFSKAAFYGIYCGIGVIVLLILGCLIFCCVRAIQNQKKNEALAVATVAEDGQATHQPFSVTQVYQGVYSKEGLMSFKPDPRGLTRSSLFIVCLALIASAAVEMSVITYKYLLLEVEVSASTQELQIELSGTSTFASFPLVGYSITWDDYCEGIAKYDVVIEAMRQAGILIPGLHQCDQIKTMNAMIYTALSMFALGFVFSLWGVLSICSRGFFFFLGWVFSIVALVLWNYAIGPASFSTDSMQAGLGILLAIAVGVPFILTCCIPDRDRKQSRITTIIINQQSPQQPATATEQPQMAKTENV